MAKKVRVSSYESDKIYINKLYVLRAVEKTTDYDEEIIKLREKINQFEFGSFNNTLTNKKQYSYKDLISLKKNKDNFKK